MNAPPATPRRALLGITRMAGPVGFGGLIMSCPDDVRPEYADPFSTSIGIRLAIPGDLGALDAPNLMPAGSTEAATSTYGPLPFSARQTYTIRPRAYA